jgi:hypothetical protein
MAWADGILRGELIDHLIVQLTLENDQYISLTYQQTGINCELLAQFEYHGISHQSEQMLAQKGQWATMADLAIFLQCTQLLHSIQTMYLVQLLVLGLFLTAQFFGKIQIHSHQEVDAPHRSTLLYQEPNAHWHYAPI